MIRILLLFIVFIISAAAYANETDTLCLKVLGHKVAENVKYVPGIDVNGKAVLPADINVQSAIIPEVMTIPLTFDLAERLGELPEGLEMHAQLGSIEVNEHGSVMLNGQDFTQETLAICNGNTIDIKRVIMVEQKSESVENATSVNKLPLKSGINEEIIYGEGN